MRGVGGGRHVCRLLLLRGGVGGDARALRSAGGRARLAGEAKHLEHEWLEAARV